MGSFSLAPKCPKCGGTMKKAKIVSGGGLGGIVAGLLTLSAGLAVFYLTPHQIGWPVGLALCACWPFILRTNRQTVLLCRACRAIIFEEAHL